MKIKNNLFEFRFCYFLLLISFLSANFVQAQDQLKILQYNVLEGFKGDSLIQNQYIAWVKEINPDIVAYQEMNGFTQKKLENFASRYGHDYAVLLKTEGYPVALSSKFPILNVQKVIDNMHHGYIYAHTANLHLFVIHFSPHQWTKRKAEVQQILAHAALLPQNERILITGDFNSYSPSDSAIYDKERLKSYTLYEGKNKHIRNLKDGKFDYSVIASIEKAGYKDLFKRFHNDFIQSSVGSRQRIDFMFGNKAMVKGVLSSEFIIDSATQKLSDHFPTLGVFKFK
ncbi:MAG: endonuclease/exonuclease/phosphatase family protein [Prolixibacteraceae bacterium]